MNLKPKISALKQKFEEIERNIKKEMINSKVGSKNDIPIKDFVFKIGVPSKTNEKIFSIQNLEQDLKQKHEIIIKLEKENEILKDQFENLRNMKKNLEEVEKNKADPSTDGVKSPLIEQQEVISALEKENEKLRREIDDLNRKQQNDLNLIKEKNLEKVESSFSINDHIEVHLKEQSEMIMCLENENKKLKEELEYTNKKGFSDTQAEDHIKKELENLKNLKRENEKLKLDLQNVGKKRTDDSEFELNLKEQNEITKSLESQNKDLKEELEALKKELNKFLDVDNDLQIEKKKKYSKLFDEYKKKVIEEEEGSENYERIKLLKKQISNVIPSEEEFGDKNKNTRELQFEEERANICSQLLKAFEKIESLENENVYIKKLRDELDMKYQNEFKVAKASYETKELDMNNKLETLEKNLGETSIKYEASIHEYKKNNETLQEKLFEKQEELTKLLGNYNQLSQQSTLTETIKQLHSERDELAKAVNSLMKKNSALKKQLKNDCSEIKNELENEFPSYKSIDQDEEDQKKEDLNIFGI